MRYRKFKADALFTGKELLDSNNILITGENGIIESVVKEQDAGDNIEILEGIISPGFINSHCHLELSHMKDAVEPGTGLIDFLIKVVSDRMAVKEAIDVAIENTDKEMFNAGIVAVGDICNTADSLSTKLQSKIYYHNFIEALGFAESAAAARFSAYQAVYDKFYEAGFTENTSIVPHAPYTISAGMFHLINEASAGRIISIHNQECLAEDELYQTKTGDFFRLYHHLKMNTDFFQPYKKTSLQSYLPLIDKPKTVLLVHNTFTKQSDIEFSVEQSKKTSQQIFWCICANANLYIENALPPVELLKQNNCNIVLGTDSYSSNTSLNILDELKTLQKNFPSILLEEMLQWATANGAKALGIDHKFGSFEPGKQPGVMLITNLHNKKLNQASVAKRIF